MAWGLPADVDAPAFLALIERLDCRSLGRLEAGAIEELADSLTIPSSDCRSTLAALAAVAWSRVASQLRTLLSTSEFDAFLARLRLLTGEAEGVRCPLVRQLLGGELPLVLSTIVNDDEAAGLLAEKARTTLSEGLVELLDENGLPRAEHLDLVRPLLACWTRSRLLMKRKRLARWTDEAEVQYQWLVRGALRLTRHDGRHVFSNGHFAGNDAELLDAALALGGDSDDHRIAAVVLPQARKAPATAKPARRALPAASANSEWAATSLMRTDWSRDALRLTAAWPAKSCRVELARGKSVLLSGLWEMQIQLDGQTLEPTTEWEQICWSSDEDVDYVELEINLAGAKVQRHILLARKDRFAFLADAVMADRRGALAYRGALSLGAGASVRPMKDSREVVLACEGQQQALVLPLGLGEWHEDGEPGSLRQCEKSLELCQSAEGQRLLAPLWIDLDAKRFDSPLTWRRLTVGEALKPVARDVACGYRVTVGKQTWLVYRALGPRANRTLLGHNISHEMLVGRFDRKGEVEPLIEIE